MSPKAHQERRLVKKNRRTIDLVFLCTVIVITALSATACSSSSSSSLKLYIINAPSILTVNQSVSLTAGVRSDSTSSSVDWTCSAADGLHRIRDGGPGDDHSDRD
jgi:hypothetical protein